MLNRAGRSALQHKDRIHVAIDKLRLHAEKYTYKEFAEFVGAAPDTCRYWVTKKSVPLTERYRKQLIRFADEVSKR